MLNLLYFFLPLILVIGFITTYTDIKKGKIRNKHIVLAFIVGSIIYVFLLILKIISIKLILLTLINLGMGVVVSVLLWFLGFWSAGDSKLFVLYLFLVPTYFYRYQSYTFLTLLVNIVLPAAIYFIFVLLFKTNTPEKILFIKKYLSFNYLYTSILLIFSVGWIIQIIFSLLHIPSNLLVSMLIMIGIDKLIRRILKFNIIYTYLFISLLRIIFQLQSIIRLQFWYSFAVFTVGFMIIRGFILDMSLVLFSKDVSVNNLKVGMIPAENIIKTKKENKIIYEKVPMTGLFSSSQIQNEQYLLTTAVEGLTRKDISCLKKNSVQTLKIQQTIPFAPFMFAGVMIIVLFGVDIITVLITLIPLHH